MDISEKNFISPHTVLCKMKNKLSVSSQFSNTNPTTCREINEAIYESVLSFLNNSEKDGLLERGFEIVFEDDIENSTGISWVSTGSKQKLEGNTLHVSSSTLYTDLKAAQRFAGMRYCKLMSPVRMLEWLSFESKFIK